MFARDAFCVKTRNILVVATAPDYREELTRAFAARGWVTFEAASRAECARILERRRVDAVVIDVQATGRHDCLPESVDVPVVTIATLPSPEHVRALRLRSREVLTKPVETAELGRAVEAAFRAPRRRVRSAPVPRSAAMRELLAAVERLRGSDYPVLVLGETGTGKTMLARRIHAIGARPEGSFVDLNCAGLSSDFLESELFGHERGAFTGAHASKPGLLDVADGGSLFLDEIGDIDLRVQPKILKVLEERKFRRMGDVRERAVDVRLIAATHHDLIRRIAERSFRADLYYRISAIKLVIPPLRERREDIIPLARDFLTRRSASATLSRDAEERLLEHPWPGNIRELKNVIDSSSILAPRDALRARDLRFDTLPPDEVSASEPSRASLPPASMASRAEIERKHIELALAAENGHVGRAAQRLAIPRSTLYWKLSRWKSH